jgi:hypothetical protein
MQDGEAGVAAHAQCIRGDQSRRYLGQVSGKGGQMQRRVARIVFLPKSGLGHDCGRELPQSAVFCRDMQDRGARFVLARKGVGREQVAGQGRTRFAQGAEASVEVLHGTTQSDTVASTTVKIRSHRVIGL